MACALLQLMAGRDLIRECVRRYGAGHAATTPSAAQGDEPSSSSRAEARINGGTLLDRVSSAGAAEVSSKDAAPSQHPTEAAGPASTNGRSSDSGWDSSELPVAEGARAPANHGEPPRSAACTEQQSSAAEPTEAISKQQPDGASYQGDGSASLRDSGLSQVDAVGIESGRLLDRASGGAEMQPSIPAGHEAILHLGVRMPSRLGDAHQGLGAQDTLWGPSAGAAVDGLLEGRPASIGGHLSARGALRA